jgi:hypothetical protein
MVHPVVGFRTTTKEGTDVNLDLGYKFQRAFFVRELYNGDIEERTVQYRRLTIRIGLSLWK